MTRCSSAKETLEKVGEVKGDRKKEAGEMKVWKLKERERKGGREGMSESRWRRATASGSGQERIYTQNSGRS